MVRSAGGPADPAANEPQGNSKRPPASAAVKRNLSPSGFSSSSSTTQLHPVPQPLHLIRQGANNGDGFFDMVESGDFDSDQRERTLKRLQDQLDMQKEMEIKRKELEALMRN